MSRSVVVTGGASGIGLATVHRLHREGWHVVAVDRNTDALPEDERITPVLADVTDETQVDAAVEAADRLGDGLGAVVTCAGVVRNAPVTETTLADFRRSLDVNLTGTFLVCRAAARVMLQRGAGGSLVTISSVSGLRGGEQRAGYASSKGGVLALTQVLAGELGPAGIRANCVAPGATDTPLVRVAQPPAVRDAVVASIPLGRYAHTEEIAAVIAFLAGSESTFVTGQTWCVDGGQTAGPGWRLGEKP
ncbi:SDR family NAD(P)-dependent oxidoreductase [Amycolatopsis jejuensis]|uniref:SDR family NAD(P)-dependent oxidoreductase n=1 Tax=Amycolatopsis jejuensis TaxID=330084 RepID=UPI000525CFC8|nr:SDR family oxidoreductase [Amycolatopsis jejuensis]